MARGKALQLRHERLAKATSDVAPILWQYGALARLPKGSKHTRILLPAGGLIQTIY